MSIRRRAGLKLYTHMALVNIDTIIIMPARREDFHDDNDHDGGKGVEEPIEIESSCCTHMHCSL